MNLTARQLRQQFDAVVSNGWWAHLEAAARQYFPAGEFDAFDLFAVGSRETNWNPKYLREPGDRGHGFGPMQIDSRSFPDWIRTGQWRDPRAAIMKGAEVLRAKLDQVRQKEGKTITVTSRKVAYRVTGKRLADWERKKVALAAYNSGQWAHYHASKGRDPDRGTTGADYGADVLERAETARSWTGGDAAPSSPPRICPQCGGTGKVPA